MAFLLRLGWLACVVYSTIPLFWLMIHPRAHRWRKLRSPFPVLLSAWMFMWIVTALVTAHWRKLELYSHSLTWIPAIGLFALGMWLYRRAGAQFSWQQLGGLPEIRPRYREQRLVTTGIRHYVRHPVYLGHLCEMFAWSLGTGLLVCWCLTLFATITGAVMIRLEGSELEKRFGEEHIAYRQSTGAILPKFLK